MSLIFQVIRAVPLTLHPLTRFHRHIKARLTWFSKIKYGNTRKLPIKESGKTRDYLGIPVKVPYL